MLASKFGKEHSESLLFFYIRFWYTVARITGRSSVDAKEYARQKCGERIVRRIEEVVNNMTYAV